MHVLPPLPYTLTSLEPRISAETLALHHGKHHRAYVDSLNDTLSAYPQYQELTIEQLLEGIDSIDAAARPGIRNFGGGHANHSLFWETMTAHPRPPSTSLASSINKDFGSLDGLLRGIRKATDELFGSGWVFLGAHRVHGSLHVMALPNQDSPWSRGFVPLLAFDLWEHAYYLQYHNQRHLWLDAWWHLVNWNIVEQKLQPVLHRAAA